MEFVNIYWGTARHHRLVEKGLLSERYSYYGMNMVLSVIGDVKIADVTVFEASRPLESVNIYCRGAGRHHRLVEKGLLLGRYSYYGMNMVLYVIGNVKVADVTVFEASRPLDV
jgi:hypothetical protein